ncbi:MAG: hypothetical protein II969_03210 [Anaerolineaceae bacterium]|nr:hypothetical protein [Anaerolineaceae bacterium]
MAANSSNVNTNPKGSLIDVAADLLGGSGIDLETVVDLAASAVSGSSKKKSGSSRKKDSKSDSLISKLIPGKTEYPQFSEKTYWAVREKFQKSIPEKVTASTLTNATGLKAETIKSSVLPALEVLGLLKDSKPTSKLKAWINDAKYEDTCKDIAESVYPMSLMKLGFNTKAEKDSAQRWFEKYNGVSAATAKKMLGIYLLFVDPKLKASADKKAASAAKKSPSTSKKSSSDASVDLKVTTKGGKATIALKIIADEGISKKALTSLFTDAAADAFDKMN